MSPRIRRASGVRRRLCQVLTSLQLIESCPVVWPGGSCLGFAIYRVRGAGEAMAPFSNICPGVSSSPSTLRGRPQEVGSCRHVAGKIHPNRVGGYCSRVLLGLLAFRGRGQVWGRELQLAASLLHRLHRQDVCGVCLLSGSCFWLLCWLVRAGGCLVAGSGWLSAWLLAGWLVGWFRCNLIESWLKSMTRPQWYSCRSVVVVFAGLLGGCLAGVLCGLGLAGGLARSLVRVAGSGWLVRLGWRWVAWSCFVWFGRLCSRGSSRLHLGGGGRSDGGRKQEPGRTKGRGDL